MGTWMSKQGLSAHKKLFYIKGALKQNSEERIGQQPAAATGFPAFCENKIPECSLIFPRVISEILGEISVTQNAQSLVSQLAGRVTFRDDSQYSVAYDTCLWQ